MIKSTVTFFPNLPLLESLRFENTSRKKNPLKIHFSDLIEQGSLKNLHTLSLKGIEINPKLIKQIKAFPKNTNLFLDIDCFHVPITAVMTEPLKDLGPNCEINWNITSVNFAFPEQNLNLLQHLKCSQKVNFKLGRNPSDEQINLLKSFKSVSIILIPVPCINGVKERIEMMLPDLTTEIWMDDIPEFDTPIRMTLAPSK